MDAAPLIRSLQTSVAQAEVTDWLTMVAYLPAVLSCTRAAQHAQHVRAANEPVFWWASAVLLILLGINEVLDLQTLLTSAGREHAKANGWYGRHRTVQHAFVLALLIGATIAAILVVWLTRRAHATVWIALVGLGLIMLFILQRAASFHHMDNLLGSEWKRFSSGSLQELAGILIVTAAAVLFCRENWRKS